MATLLTAGWFLAFAITGHLPFLAQMVTVATGNYDPSYDSFAEPPPFPLTILATLLASAINLYGSVGITRGGLLAADGHSITVPAMVKNIPWLRVIGTTVLYNLVILLIALLSLGYLSFIGSFFLMFAMVAVLDGNVSAPAAISRSASLVRHNFGRCLGFFLLAASLNALGLLLCVLPAVLVFAPVTSIAIAHFYRALSTGTPAATS